MHMGRFMETTPLHLDSESIIVMQTNDFSSLGSLRGQHFRAGSNGPNNGPGLRNRRCPTNKTLPRLRACFSPGSLLQTMRWTLAMRTSVKPRRILFSALIRVYIIGNNNITYSDFALKSSRNSNEENNIRMDMKNSLFSKNCGFLAAHPCLDYKDLPHGILSGEYAKSINSPINFNILTLTQMFADRQKFLLLCR